MKVADTAKATVAKAENLGRKAWTVLDAASKKERPSEVLSNKGKMAIQGIEKP